MGLVHGECRSCGSFLTFSDKKSTITCKYCKKELKTDASQKLYKSTIKDIDKAYPKYQKYTDEINKNLHRQCSYKVGKRTEKYELEQALYKTFNLQEVDTGTSSIACLEGITDTGIFVFKTNEDEKIYCRSLIKEFNKDTLKKLLDEYKSSCDEALLKIDALVKARNRSYVLKMLLSIIKVIIMLIVNILLFITGHPIFGILCLIITIWITIGSYISISDSYSSIDKKR